MRPVAGPSPPEQRPSPSPMRRAATTAPSGATQPAPVTFDLTLWRALAVFRLATLAYAVILIAGNFSSYDHPLAGWAVILVMAGWTAATISAYTRPSARTWPWLGADLAVTAACLLASRWVIGGAVLATGVPTIPITWMACPVLAVAVARGRRWGAAAALVIGACDLLVRGQLNQATLTGTVIMVMAATVVGHLAHLAADVQERLRRAAELEAVTRERDRLARGIHDSVLQVLALVQRRGTELGGEAAELGRLAGEQEVALRALVTPDATSIAPAGLADLSALLAGHAGARVALATPATPVWLPAPVAGEVAAAVGSALDNVHRHAGPDAHAWVLVEEQADAVTVTVRDDGPGIPPGRLDQAVAEGRLGIAKSIQGRIADVGGEARVTAASGSGTEVELRIPRNPAPRRPAGRSR